MSGRQPDAGKAAIGIRHRLRAVSSLDVRNRDTGSRDAGPGLIDDSAGDGCRVHQLSPARGDDIGKNTDDERYAAILRAEVAIICVGHANGLLLRNADSVYDFLEYRAV